MKATQVTKVVQTPEDKFYQTQYIFDDGSYILVSDKWGKDYFQHGKNVPGKNRLVIYAMNQALANYLKKQAANV